MKHYFSWNKLVLGLTIASWVIPFVISAFFVDIETGELKISPLLFHGGLFILFTGLIYAFYSKLKIKKLLSLSVANTFVATNIVLDIVILYATMGAVTLSEWAMMIFPVYIIVCYGMYYVMKK